MPEHSIPVHPLRKAKRALSPEQTRAVLQAGTSGVLALVDAEGWPYAVPLSYALEEGSLYFHCAREGHKLDAIRNNSRASFCVIGRDAVIPEKYTTNFQSAIVFGTVHILEDEADIRHALKLLSAKYSPSQPHADVTAKIDEAMGRVTALRLDIAHMSGKERR